MATTHPRHLARPFASRVPLDAVIASFGVLLLAAMTLLTPAFTDYESETEPAVQALIHGHVGAGLPKLPIYGGSVLAETPLAWLVHLFGGGDLAIYRAVAVPGALGVVWCATLAARWMREAGQRRRNQMAALGAIALSPCLSMAWIPGHPEELLVTAVAVAGLLLVARGGSRDTITGGVLMGLAAAGKQWALLLLPLGLACSPSGRQAIRFCVSAGVAAVLLTLPVLLPQISFYTTAAKTSGGGGIFTIGNLWWWTGDPNPNYNGGTFGESSRAKTFEAFTTDNSARLGPHFVEAHAQQLIVVLSVVLAAAWWWRVGRTLNAAPSPGETRGADGAAGRLRVTSILMIAGAIMFWRAFADPWYQAYYLAPALTFIVLADARRGRLPVTGLVAWAVIWLMYGQNAPHMGLDADGTSALRQAFLIPFGLWITTRALRPLR